MYSVFVCCQRAVSERDCPQWYNGRGEKSRHFSCLQRYPRYWKVFIRKIVRVNFGNNSSFFFSARMHFLWIIFDDIVFYSMAILYRSIPI